MAMPRFILDPVLEKRAVVMFGKDRRAIGRVNGDASIYSGSCIGEWSCSDFSGNLTAFDNSCTENEACIGVGKHTRYGRRALGMGAKLLEAATMEFLKVFI
jgi:hypothetical protein